MQVIDKFLSELCMQLKEKKVELSVTPEAKEWIYSKGFQPEYGARPFARTIDEYVKKPLVDEMLFGKLANGGKVKINANSSGLALSFS